MNHQPSCRAEWPEHPEDSLYCECKPTRTRVLEEASRLIDGERSKVYGDPRVNHDRIARLFSVVLGIEVTASTACLLMACVKIARLVQTPDHLDSLVDLAAYAALAAECLEEPAA
jgi:hypothetical protein